MLESILGSDNPREAFSEFLEEFDPLKNRKGVQLYKVIRKRTQYFVRIEIAGTNLLYGYDSKTKVEFRAISDMAYENHSDAIGIARTQVKEAVRRHKEAKRAKSETADKKAKRK